MANEKLLLTDIILKIREAQEKESLDYNDFVDLGIKQFVRKDFELPAIRTFLIMNNMMINGSPYILQFITKGLGFTKFDMVTVKLALNPGKSAAKGKQKKL